MINRRWWPPIGFALIWVVAASVATNTTFHLAPAIVAAAGPFPFRERRLVWAAFGSGLAITVAGGLSLANRLTGPSLLPTGGALLESILAAGLGGMAGLAFAGRIGQRRMSGLRP